MSIIQSLSLKHTISIEDFSSIMSSFCLNGKVKIAVAVSGGSDSLCLALLLKYWSKNNNAEIISLIVNHNLRVNINEEIKQVTTWLHKYNIKTVVLSINGLNKNSKLQQSARKERYKVLLQYCEDNYITYLMVGHHFNDLIETLIMRKKRKASIWGYSSISLIKNFKKVLLFRPLLFFSKQAIQNTLKNMNQCWIEDPSNQNTNFERVKVRQQLGILNEQQIIYYSNLINNYRTNRIKLEQDCLEYLVRACKITKFGEVLICFKTFLNLKLNLQIAIIGLIIKFISNKEYMPKINKIKILIDKINNHTISYIKNYTLGGSLIKLKKVHNKLNNNQEQLGEIYIKFIREPKSISHKVKISDINGNHFIWDNRFLVSNINNFPKNYFFAKLNTSEYNSLCRVSEINIITKKAFLERDSILSLPWVFDENNNPVIGWINYLLNKDYVNFSPINDLLSDIFYNFGIAKENHLN